MEEVEHSTNPVNEVAKPEDQKVEESKVEGTTTAEEEEEEKMEVDSAEEFVVVEGGGEGDPLAQEMAVVQAEKKEVESAVEEKVNESDGAGAQTSVDNVVEPTIAPTATLPG